VVAAASVQRRGPAAPLPGVSYCPKGPALDYGDTCLFDAVLRLLAEDARRQRSVFLSIEPEAEVDTPGAVATLRGAGYVPSTNQLQASATFLVDAAASDEELLGRMSSTWRRYIRKAPRDGVAVRRGTAADLDRFYQLYRQTSERDAFVARPRWYVESLWRHLAPPGLLDLFLAEVGGRAEAALMPLRFGRRAWYLYGASSAVAQKAHAPYLLQWHTMRWARDHGCDTYDMWGAAADPSDESDPLAGVTRQKRGYGGRHVRWVGGYDYVASPALYAVWQRAVPRAFAALRRLRGERGAPVRGRALGGCRMWTYASDEDAVADVDCNIVMTDAHAFVEI
jgi:lipid II:glycine glycyltransferase (peptidoglycan interpeptide bridge formation enzyme)